MPLRQWVNRTYGCGSYYTLTPGLSITVDYQGNDRVAPDYGKFKVMFAGYTLKERFTSRMAAELAGIAFASSTLRRLAKEMDGQ